MIRKLEGKVVLLTGAEIPVQTKVALKLAAEGASIAIHSHSESWSRTVVGLLRRQGAKAWAYTGPLQKPTDAIACLDGIIERSGRLDAILAGMEAYSAPTLQTYPLEEASNTFDSMKATLLLLKYGMPQLQASRGSIVLLGIERSLEERPCHASGAVALRAWCHSLVQQVSQEQAQYGVRVNNICSIQKQTQTQPQTQQSELRLRSPEWLTLTGWLPQPAPAQPLPLLSAVLVPDLCIFLASRASKSISGTTIPFAYEMEQSPVLRTVTAQPIAPLQPPSQAPVLTTPRSA